MVADTARRLSSVRKTEAFSVISAWSSARMSATRSVPCPLRSASTVVLTASSKPAARPGGAVDGHAGALAGGVEPGGDGAGGVEDDLGGDIGRDAAHGVVGRGLDRDQFGLGLDAEVGADELGDIGQLLVDLLGGQVGEV